MGNSLKNISDKSQPSYEGTVLWFRDDLGYGYIENKSFTKSIYAHYKRIVSNEQFKTLSKGQLVIFEVAESEKGLMAINIREKKIIPAKALVVNSQ